MTETEKKYHYHISDDKHDHAKFDTDEKMDRDSYPYVVTPIPDDLLGKPVKFDWRNFRWYDNGQESYGQAIAGLKDSVKQLNQANEQLQEARTETAKTSQTLTAQINGLQKLVVQTNANVAQSMNATNRLVQNVKQLSEQISPKKEEGTN